MSNKRYMFVYREISSSNMAGALEHIRNYLNHSSVVISHRQIGIHSLTGQVEKQLGSVESKIEKRLHSAAKFSAELNRLEDANAMSKNLSKNLRDLATRLNQINSSLDESERLDPFKFD